MSTYDDREPYMIIRIEITKRDERMFRSATQVIEWAKARGYLIECLGDVEEIVEWVEHDLAKNTKTLVQEVYHYAHSDATKTG